MAASDSNPHEQRTAYEIARRYREYAGAVRSKVQPSSPLAAALATAISELELAAELTAGQTIQHHIDSKLPLLRAALRTARDGQS